jgi:hypothetical protein
MPRIFTATASPSINELLRFHTLARCRRACPLSRTTEPDPLRPSAGRATRRREVLTLAPERTASTVLPKEAATRWRAPRGASYPRGRNIRTQFRAGASRKRPAPNSPGGGVPRSTEAKRHPTKVGCAVPPASSSFWTRRLPAPRCQHTDVCRHRVSLYRRAHHRSPVRAPGDDNTRFASCTSQASSEPGSPRSYPEP